MGKNLKEAYKQISKEKVYSIRDGIDLIKKLSFEKFNSSVEVSFNLNLNAKKADQQLRGSIVLPHGNGKIAKVLVVAEKDDQEIAKKAGADFFGDETILNKIEKENWFDFDFIVTTPKFMPKFAKFGKLLGPKGLMPNPKLGTVTTDIEKTLKDIKHGQIEYRTNQQGIVNLSIGKKSFKTDMLVENYKFVFSTIKSKKPASLKGDLIKTIHVSTTMGPGILIDKDGGVN
ncbi:MAG: 50S ribosomal protein L1 [Candidatus Hepatoplasma vulgare]|nr:MAG: 50S ribosomal protein L1 [Candidatus Hepatoplasma sp.]